MTDGFDNACIVEGSARGLQEGDEITAHPYDFATFDRRFEMLIILGRVITFFAVCFALIGCALMWYWALSSDEQIARAMRDKMGAEQIEMRFEVTVK